MQTPLTVEELAVLPGISAADNTLINETVDDAAGNDDAKMQVRALRGYLAGQILEEDDDPTLREDLSGMAASFVDGWNYCQEYGPGERLLADIGK
jgi:hypothetical protein